MVNSISQDLANQIVSTVKDVCGKDINYIEPNGIIYASTNASRVGTFHEIGKRVADTGQSIEVKKEVEFAGTDQGVNIPIYYNRNLLAVIGITGNPDEIRKYGHLAVRITKMLIREKELNESSRNREGKRNYIISTLISGEAFHKDNLVECLQEFGVRPDTEKRMVILKLTSHDVRKGSSAIDIAIIDVLQEMSCDVYTFRYPNEYLALIDEKDFLRKEERLKAFAVKNRAALKIAVGRSTDLWHIAGSYQAAEIAMRSMKESEEHYALYDVLNLEVLLASMKECDQKVFLQKITGKLSQTDKELLCVYYESNMSLSRTCEKLYLHKNTVQYRLNRIFKVSGYDPRKFQDAVLFYVALQLEKCFKA